MVHNVRERTLTSILYVRRNIEERDRSLIEKRPYRRDLSNSMKAGFKLPERRAYLPAAYAGFASMIGISIGSTLS